MSVDQLLVRRNALLNVKWVPFAGQLRPLKLFALQVGDGYGFSIDRIGSIAFSWSLAFPVLLPLQEMGWMISASQGEVFIGQA